MPLSLRKNIPFHVNSTTLLTVITPTPTIFLFHQGKIVKTKKTQTGNLPLVYNRASALPFFLKIRLCQEKLLCAWLRNKSFLRTNRIKEELAHMRFISQLRNCWSL